MQTKDRIVLEFGISEGVVKHPALQDLSLDWDAIYKHLRQTNPLLSDSNPETWVISDFIEFLFETLNTELYRNVITLELYLQYVTSVDKRMALLEEIVFAEFKSRTDNLCEPGEDLMRLRFLLSEKAILINALKQSELSSTQRERVNVVCKKPDLFDAILLEDLALVRELLTKYSPGLMLFHKAHCSYTPMHCAAYTGNVALIRMVMDALWEESMRDPGPILIQSFAASSGNVNAIEVCVIEYGLDPTLIQLDWLNEFKNKLLLTEILQYCRDFGPQHPIWIKLVDYKLRGRAERESYAFLAKGKVCNFKPIQFCAAQDSVQFILMMLETCFALEIWALMQKPPINTGFLIEGQFCLLNALKNKITDQHCEARIAAYQEAVSQHCQNSYSAVTNENPDWESHLHNLTLGAEYARPAALHFLREYRANEVKRLHNLIQHEQGDVQQHLTDLTTLSKLGEVNASQLLHEYYKQKANDLSQQAEGGNQLAETTLKELAQIRSEAKFALAKLCYRRAKVSSFSVTQGAGVPQLFEELTAYSPNAYLYLGNCYAKKVGVKEDVIVALDYYYRAVQGFCLQAITGISNYTNAEDKGHRIIALLYMKLLQPVHLSMNGESATHRLNTLYSRDPTLIKFTLTLIGKPVVTRIVKIGLLQLVLDFANASDIATAKNLLRLQFNEISQLPNKRHVFDLMQDLPKLVAVNQITDYALIVFDDRSIAPEIRQAWIVLAFHQQSQFDLVSISKSDNFQSLSERYSRIPEKQRSDLTKAIIVSSQPHPPTDLPYPPQYPEPTGLLA